MRPEDADALTALHAARASLAGGAEAAPHDVSSPAPARPTWRNATVRYPAGSVDRETLDPAARVRLRLQRHAGENLRLHTRRALARFVILIGADLATFGGLRALSRFASDQGWLGDAATAALQAILGTGYLDGWQYPLALFLGLFTAGNYGSGDRRHDTARLFAGTGLATAFVLWAPIWQRGFDAVALAYIACSVTLWVALVAERSAVHLAAGAIDRRRSVSARTLVVGFEDDYRASRQRSVIEDNPEFAVAGFVDVTRPAARGALGHVDELGTLLAEHQIDTVLVCGYVTDQTFRDIADKALAAGCQLLSVPRSFDVGGLQPKMVWRRGQPFIELTTPTLKDGQLCLKRILDLAGSSLGLVALAPLFGLIAIAVKLDSRGPAIFAHRRLGLNGRRFKCYKFRSMHADADSRLRSDPVLYARYVANSYKLPEDQDPRLTRVGRFLRRTSLDELPQLLDVLKGEMSLVGPRPIVFEELEEYGRGAAVFLSQKPGITGAWQVSGRSRVGYPDRALIELEYVRNWSLGRDLRIMLRTLPAVLAARGAH
jgi:exopolysaccharide production protein ExoY